MLLKLLLFALIAITIYKLLGGKLPSLAKAKQELYKHKEQKKIEEDTLIECQKCSTYVTFKESIIVKGKAYCSKECAGL